MKKRFLYLSIIFIVSNLQLSKADYFTPSYSGNPFSPMGFLVTSVTVEGNALETGDELGIYDGTLCVGNFVFDGSSNFGMTTSMNDPSSNSVGYIPGHDIKFRIWLKKSNLLIRNVKVIYNNELDTLFKPYGIAIIELSGKKDPQNPEITEGQSFTIPENALAKLIVGKIGANYASDGTCLFKIQSGNSNNIFTIDSVDGTISLNQSGLLNYEVTNNYNLVVKLFNKNYDWIFDTSSVQINITKVTEEIEIKTITEDTAYVGTPYLTKIDLSGLNANAISLSQIEIPSWLSYRQDNSNFLIIEGIPQNKDQGEYKVTLGITDGYTSLNSNIDLKVLTATSPTSIGIRNNPSHGNFSLVIDPDQESRKIDIIVYSLSGSIVYNNSIENESNQLIVPIDLTGKPKNTYILEVITDKKKLTGSLVLL